MTPDPKEVAAFEEAVWSYYQTLKDHGWSAPEEGDTSSSEALFWREPSGKYGVQQIEAAWWGWRLRGLKHPKKARRVVCAAIRAADGSLLLGIRHYDDSMVGQMRSRCDGLKFQQRSGDDQGFVDQHGVYMTREEAMQVAAAAGQLISDNIRSFSKLYSEDIY